MQAITLLGLWVFSIDRFANHYNTKLERFNSKFHVPETKGMDAVLQEWSEENNLFVPPVKVILKVLNCIQSSKKILVTL